ncbi:MAG TPA: hypothetical protein VNO31_37315, partial [Umezawaea sp.]|nr:hypothetical protein [Umezawaea sp.]
MRLLTSAFAWMVGLALVVALVFTGRGPLHYPLVVLAVVVLATWLVSPDGDAWWVSAAEGVVA